MKNLRCKVLVLGVLLSSTACTEWLTTEPQTILTDEQVWGDPSLVLSVLADYYDRIPLHQGLTNAYWPEFTAFDEALYSGVGRGCCTGDPGPGGRGAGYGSLQQFAYNRWASWGQPYGLIRDIHVAMDGVEASTSGSLPPEVKTQFLAELRFQRAFTYFELVKRYGGVPLVTSQLLYDFSGDVTPLQLPRASEAGVYDFIGDELDAIMDELGNEGSQTRASRAAALALKSRAMLYAGSVARHNSEMGGPITLQGGEIGIPASRAGEYYLSSLEASRMLINGGTHTLVEDGDPGEGFHQVFVRKGNSEVIFALDYLSGQGKVHYFTLQAYPRSQRVVVAFDWGGAAVSPTLNLVENFDYLDGSSGALRGVGDGTVASQNDWIFYDDISDIFDGKDGRLKGTVIVPGDEFAGKPVDLQAGVYAWNAAANRYDRVTGNLNSTYTDGGRLTGTDGPVHQEDWTSASGFYIRKYLDPATGAATYSPGADTWWVWFRLGEIYMNATEAAFELGLHSEALGYINTLRERAGFSPNSLTALTRAKIRSERWSELAFEDHRLWDLIRWRIAHEVWNGVRGTPTADMYVLFPYRVSRPGHPNHGKYVFDKFVSSVNTAPKFFRMGNYYSQIPNSALSANPQIIRNPFH
ncbi:MAG TPA: RagB/SusD family nutrient uptake outer membrane protein [Rhodothermales bacterium]|nr:RagB/SusD family nutrient uptake outer membrane protein [Rhodothermales bacterium]